MRTVSATLFMSVDGVIESPNLWQFDSFDDELGAVMGGTLAEAEDVILGRVLYEQWSAHWTSPGADDPFGDFINPVRKHVASRTLSGELSWQNSTLIAGDLRDYVRDLAAGEGGRVHVPGSIQVIHHLLEAELISELILIIHPALAGTGRHLYGDGLPIRRLALRSATSTAAGNIVARYAPRPTSD